jgi:hypothetical protein
MKKYATFVRAGLGLILAAMTSGDALRALGGPESRADLIRVTVTVTSTDKNAPPALEKRDVLVRQENDRRPVVDWVAAQDDRAALDFAILIDDSLDSGVGNQFKDIRAFLRSLPATARVGVAYSAHGSATWRQEFTTDREVAAKALRLPNGRISDGASIYLALADLVKNGRRAETVAPCCSSPMALTFFAAFQTPRNTRTSIFSRRLSWRSATA